MHDTAAHPGDRVIPRVPVRQVLYRMKRTFSDGTSTIQFTPRDFVARLCALMRRVGAAD